MRARRGIHVLLLVLAVGALSGCFQSLVLVRVNKDGSGTIEETMLLTEAFSQLLATLSGQEAPTGREETDDVDEAQLQERARAMGEGVRLVSAEPVKNEKASGYRAVFSFPDVTGIRVSQHPSAGMPAGPEAQPEGAAQDGSEDQWLLFRFSRGAASTLEVVFPQPAEHAAEEQEEAGPAPDESPEMMDMGR